MVSVMSLFPSKEKSKVADSVQRMLKHFNAVCRSDA